MCEFCLKHGEGKKWYLQAENYSQDLLSDLRRRKFIRNFLRDEEHLKKSADNLEKLDKLPHVLRSLISRVTTSRMKKVHFGQVVPLEDIEKILRLVNSIVRVACICRKAILREEKRYCYGISVAPGGGRINEILGGLDKNIFSGPGAAGREELSADDALSQMHGHETEGLCHTVWTFHTPFIAAICNCDRTDCMAMRCTLDHNTPVMFRAEYVASVQPDLCTGCRQCMRVCQFGAMGYSASKRKVEISPWACYGCGICRSACSKAAIELKDRAAHPVASRVW